MKYGTYRLLVALVLFSLCVVPMHNARADADDTPSAVHDMCVSENGDVYAVNGYGINKIAEAGVAESLVACANAYIIDYSNEHIYIVCEGDSTDVIVYDTVGNELARHTLNVSGHVFQLAVTAPYICYLYSDSQLGETYLRVLNTDDNTVSEYPNVYNPMMISAQDTRLLINCEEQPHTFPVLAILELTTGEISVALDNPYLGNMHLNPESDSCYVGGDSGLQYISWEDGKNHAESLPIAINENEIWDVNADTLYICNRATQEIRNIQLSQLNSARNELVIAGVRLNSIHSDDVSKSLSLFDEAQSGYKVVFRSYAEPDNLIVALMSRQDQIDMLYLDKFNYATYARSGVLMNLLEAPAINDLKDSGKYFDWPFEVATSEGKLWALPYEAAIPVVWAANLPLLERAGIGIPAEDWTWNDFLDVARAGAKANAPAYTDGYTVYTAPFLTNYINIFVDPLTGENEFDTDAFRELCAIWKTCIDERLVGDITSAKEPLFFPVSLSPFGTLDNDAPELIMSPMITDKRVIDMEAGLIAVNVASANTDAALKYITTYYSEAVQLVSQPNMLLFKDIDSYVVERDYRQPDEYYAFYNKAMEAASFRDEVTEIRKSVDELLGGYFESERSLDDVIRQITSAVDLILNE